MTFEQLEKYLIQCLNMSLGNTIQGETSYTNSFTCKVTDSGFYFIPMLPASFVIDYELYSKIYLIANASLYPRYTLLKQNSAYFVPMNTEDIHVQRALFFPWKSGISERIIISDLSTFTRNIKNHTIPIMKNLLVDYDDVTSIAIAGNSGAGKSYFLNYLLDILKHFSDLVVIDPKFDSPSRWARSNAVQLLHPHKSRSKSDFVSQVNQVLSDALDKIYERQTVLYENHNHKFKHQTIVIDEVMALSEGVPKAIKDSFFSLVSQIALLGRATRVHLLLVSQRFDHQTIPVSVREQLNLLVQVGNISKRSTQFLFPDLDPSGIVIPSGKGTGLVQVISPKHPYQVLPLLCPTYTDN